MDNNAPEAPTSTPEASVTTPTNTNPEPAQAPAQPSVDLGLTPEQAEKFKTFIDNSGGFDNAFSKLKTDVSAPKNTQPAQELQLTNEPTSQPQAQPAEQPKYTPPQGSITAQEFLAQQYFQGLSQDPKYEGISAQIANGDVLKEMSAFNIQALNQDGSINDAMVRRFLDLKAQTVPAKQTGTEPDMSSAPTVDYIEVGDTIKDIDQAYAVFMQPGHPAHDKAAEFIKTHLNPNAQPEKK